MNSVIRSHVQRLAVVAATGLVLVATAGAGNVAAADAKAAPNDGAYLCTAARIAARAHPTVPNYQALGDCQIDRRLATISTLQARVAASLTISANDKAALASELSSTAPGLTALRSTIDADTTLDELKADLPKIYTDYRVYVLVARQVSLVRAADGVAAADARLATTAGQLQAAIDTAKAAGKDTTKAEADLAAMNAALANAAAAVNGLSASILALTPAEWNAGTAGPALDAARAAIRTAQAQLVVARRDARRVLADLR
jgi:hypothetical protein